MQGIKFHRLVALGVASFLALTGCGGGGGGDSPPPPEPPKPVGKLDISANVSEIKGEYDVPQALHLTVKNTGAMAVTSLTPKMSGALLEPVSNSCAGIVLAVNDSCKLVYQSKATAPGQGNVNLELLFSHDGFVRQAALTIPYQFNESQWANVPPWTTYQGNASHNGYVPVSVKPANFKPDWERFPDNAVQQLTGVGSDKEKIYATARLFTGGYAVYAMSIVDGKPTWQRSLGQLDGAYAPAIADGDVFLASGGHSNTFMWKLDASTGDLKAQTPFSNQWSAYLAPVIWDQGVYANGGSYGGIYAYKRSNGTQDWFASVNQYDGWTPAVDAQHVYAYTGNYQPKLSVFERVGGKLAYEINDRNFSWNGWTMDSSPVLNEDSTRVFATQGGRALAFDLARRDMAWEVSAGYHGQVAYADQTVFAKSLSGRLLSALDAKTGIAQWTWSPPENLVSDIIVTKSHLFVASANSTFAISRSTKTQEWKHGVGGQLMLTNAGKLIIVADNGRLTAVSLR